MDRKVAWIGCCAAAVVGLAVGQPYFDLDSGELVDPHPVCSQRPNQVWAWTRDTGSLPQYLQGPGVVRTIGVEGGTSGNTVWVMGFDGQEDPIQLLPPNSLIYNTTDLNLRFSDRLIVAEYFWDDPSDDPDQGWVPMRAPEADFAILWHPLP